MGKNNKITANEFTNVKDIRDIFLYTRNGYIFCYLKVYPFNIDLLSDEEKAGKTDMLAKSFDGDRKDFAYFSYPREIDLDSYKQSLKKQYDTAFNNYGRKHILSELIQQATELETNGENYEHQQYIKIWKMAGNNKKETERDLRTRITEFQYRYDMVGIRTDIIKSDEIIKMCNLFGNSQQAPFDVPMNTIYEPMMILR